MSCDGTQRLECLIRNEPVPAVQADANTPGEIECGRVKSRTSDPLRDSIGRNFYAGRKFERQSKISRWDGNDSP